MSECQTSKVIIIVALVAGILVGAGIGYAVFNAGGDGDSEYNFYLYFEDGAADNGWYSAKGSDASDAFGKAMDKAGFEYEVGWGYVSTVKGVGEFGWGPYQYLYAEYTAEAAESSTGYPNAGADGNMVKSNGWAAIAGYGEGDDLKLNQLVGNTFFLAPYDTDWIVVSPDMVDDWTASGPFAA